MTGGGVFLLGFFIWTAIFNLPIYKAVATWNLTEATPADVRTQMRPARGLGRRQTSKSVDTRIFRALWCQISNASTV
ncbi:hypothetical protein [Nocardia sp. GAS34]|uniref:hypothetical protein n=1 Tax=Nocardia sp. GAS34 TaxID=3156305 RepID=UPI003D262DFD